MSCSWLLDKWLDFSFGVSIRNIPAFDLPGHLNYLTLPTWLNVNARIVALGVFVTAIAA